jgi:hypothetical protein
MRGVFSILLFTAALVQAQTLIAHGCYGLGANGGTTSALDTTGANFIVLGISGQVPPVVSDSKANNYTTLTSTGGAPSARISYTAVAPTVGSGHTWTVSGTSIYAAVCVEAWSGIVQASPFDTGKESGRYAGGVRSLASGSITPTDGPKLIVTALATYTPGVTPYTVDSDFINMEGLPTNTNVYYGVGMASLIQPTGVAVDPTWTESGSASNMAACQAAFKVATASLKRRVIVVN